VESMAFGQTVGQANQPAGHARFSVDVPVLYCVAFVRGGAPSQEVVFLWLSPSGAAVHKTTATLSDPVKGSTIMTGFVNGVRNPESITGTWQVVIQNIDGSFHKEGSFTLEPASGPRVSPAASGIPASAVTATGGESFPQDGNLSSPVAVAPQLSPDPGRIQPPDASQAQANLLKSLKGPRHSFQVRHAHGGLGVLASGDNWPYCEGRLDDFEDRLQFSPLGTNDGRTHPLSIPKAQLKEIKTNKMPIGSYGAFHVKLQDGTNYNLVPRDNPAAVVRALTAP